jgi:hypothetical protein
MKTNYPRYFSFLLLKTFAISSTLSIVISKIISSRHGSSFEQKQGDFIESMSLIVWLFVLTLSSIPIYLNQIVKIRSSVTTITLSFFLLPLCVSLLVFDTGNRNSEWLSFFISTAIFIIVLLFFFVKFLATDAQWRQV